MTRVLPAALDAAAAAIAAVVALPVGREPIGPDENEADGDSGLSAVLALSEGPASQELGYLMGAAAPYEFEHQADFQIVVVGGAEDERRAHAEALLADAADAIDADPTLGGRVAFAEINAAELAAEARMASIGATLTLTYAAATARG